MFSDNQLLAKINEANRFINKSYVSYLDKFDILPISDFKKKYSLIRLYLVDKIIYDQEENLSDKMASVFYSSIPFIQNLIYIIKGKKDRVELYIGTKAAQPSNAAIAGEIIHDSFLGNFPGSKISQIEVQNIPLTFKYSSSNTPNNSSIVFTNLLPSINENEKTFYVGLEKFIDSMRGLEYTCEILAYPLNNEQFDTKLSGFENIYSALSPFAKKTRSHGINEGQSITDGINENLTKTISEGISKATGNSDTYNYGNNSGFNIGAHMLLNFGSMKGTSEGWSTGSTRTDTNTHNISESEGYGKQHSVTNTKSENDSTTIEYHDKTVQNLLEKINKHISLMKSGSAYGMWETSAFFMAKDKKTAAMAASAYRSLMLGENAGIESSKFIVFNNTNSISIQEYIEYCEQPIFKIPASDYDSLHFSKPFHTISPISYISGKELPFLFRLPKKSISGISVSESAEFGRNISVKGSNAEYAEIGSIYHLGIKENQSAVIDINSLTSHCFVTGSTGSGKSNTVYTLIEKISCSDHKIPFLIIEPAKGEYRDQFRKLNNINLFTVNPQIDRMIKINPFEFNSEIHILEHLDKLVEIFNGCWEMYAAMPAILKEAIEQAYVKKGWDLLNSQYIGFGNKTYPTFYDVLYELPQIINSSDYSSDTKGDYIGALVTRVNSMTNGIYGQIFCDEFNVDDETLFDECTIIDLSRIGSSETKSLIMGILILKLSEYRIAKSDGSNKALSHLTILEEAHNILKNTKTMQSSSNNNIIAKSVEMIVNSIAEMRTYGEGFIIVDQSPTSVDIAAIKNTNTKIIMRLPEKEYCILAGHSVSLSDKQINELAKLETGVAVVMQNNWEQAVLAKINESTNLYKQRGEKSDFNKIRALKDSIVKELLNQYVLTDEHNAESILSIIEKFDINQSKKNEYSTYILKLCNSMNFEFDSILLGRSILKILGCNDAFRQSEKYLRIDNADSEKFTDESLESWHKNVFNKLSYYTNSTDDIKDIICQYIIHSKKYSNETVDYSIIYGQIY